MRKAKSLLIICTTFFGLISIKSLAATLTFPGAAPCDTTLQACVDGATSGDTIEIATDTPIEEDVDITKSLTLKAADGFDPIIKGLSTNLATLSIRDASDTADLDVTIDGLNFDEAEISVAFNDSRTHKVTIQNSSIIHSYAHDNVAGIDFSIRSNMTIMVKNNYLSTTGQPIQFISTLSAGQEINATFAGNQITTTDPANSHQGMQIRPGSDGIVNIDVFNNVIYGVGGCFCGGPSGIEFTASGDVDTAMNIVNNSINDVQGDGKGISIISSGTNSVLVNIFNNTVSNTLGRGIQLPSLSAPLTINHDFNNFFNTDTNDFGDYPPGANVLNVDPDFVDASTDDYRLKVTSPLIEAGTSTPTGGLPDTDFDGNNRVIGTNPDMGAFEFELSADLSLTKSDNPDPVDIDAELTYTLSVTNNGPDMATNVIVTDTLPTGVTFISGTFATDSNCTENTGIVTCDLGTLNNGDSVEITIVVTVNSDGPLQNDAQVTSDVPDPDESNNSVSEQTETNDQAEDQNTQTGSSCSISSGHLSSPWDMLIFAVILLLPFVNKWRKMSH